jgi:hypothetical protein
MYSTNDDGAILKNFGAITVFLVQGITKYVYTHIALTHTVEFRC